MARTYRKNDPKLVANIRRNRELKDAGLWSWDGRHDDAILRGQDGAIIYDKCQTATVDNEGGYKLNDHSYIYHKSKVKEPQKKLRTAGKNLIRSQLNG
jgi:hypothetical protein